MNVLNVAVASDLRYVAGAIGTLASIRLCLEEDICLQVIFLHDGIDREIQQAIYHSISKIKGKTLFDFKRIEMNFSEFPEFYTPSQMPYARLCLPELCNYSRVVYIDTDFIVCKSLYPLMSCKVSGSGIAAAQDCILKMIANDLKGDAPFHVNAKKSYFNTGILVLDLEVIRSNALFQKALKLLSNHPEFCASHDQSALNYVINGDFELLDESYNLQNVRVHLGPAETIKSLSERSANIHFITQKTKPWITYSPYPAETMFRILLDYVYPNWKSSDYNRNARFLRCRFFFAPLLPAFFKARGFIKRLLGKSSSLDDNASLNWKIIADDLRFLRNSAANLKVLFSGWKKQIEFRLVKK